LAVVAGLYVYPVKSCAGIALREARVLSTGFEFDRQWMVVGTDGVFLSQRQLPRLGVVKPTLDPECLRLTAPDIEPLAVPLSGDGPRRPVHVWGDTVPAADLGDAPAEWFSSVLAHDARLVRFAPDARRPCSPRYAGDTGAHTLFADGYPVLVVGKSSLADLNARLRTPIPMARFRPNLVLAQTEPFDEDHIEALTVGEVVLRLVKPCTRCQVTTVDQDTGRPTGDEPLVTLSRFRSNPELGGVTFGVNAVVASGAGSRIREGDAVGIAWRF